MKYRLEYLPDGEDGQTVVISSEDYVNIVPSLVAVRDLELIYKV